MKFKTRTATETSNFKSSKVIQAQILNPAKMLKMFTKDLYKHPLRTAIQEYINNAKDAHVMAGKDFSTIEITAPTVINQSVIIKDFGPGLSPDDMVNVFANITVSNKDKSDSFNGGYGIGSKSWFSVNTSFIIISTYNKIKSYYSVNFSEIDGITLSLDHEEKTKEPNGVEVNLPLSNVNQIKDANNAISRAIMFWKVKPKTINLSNVNQNLIHREKDYSLLSYSAGEIYVTLGDTIYSAKELPCYEYIEEELENFSIAIHFEIGEMKLIDSQEVGPDREAFALICSDKIKRKVDLVKKALIKKTNNYIKTLTDVNSIQEIVNNNSLKFRTYEHSLKDSSKIIVFNRDMNPSIKGIFPSHITVGNSVTTSNKFLKRVKGFSRILVLDKVLKNYELRSVILRLGLSETNRRYYFNNGICVLPKTAMFPKELEEINNYIPVSYSSKMEIIKPDKKIKDVSGKTERISLLYRTNTRHNATGRMNILTENLDSYQFISNKEFKLVKESWNDIKAVFTKRKPLAVIAGVNVEDIKSLNLTIRDSSWLKAIIEKDRKKKNDSLIKKVNTKEYIDYIKYDVEVLRYFIYSNLDNGEVSCWIGNFIKLFPNHKTGNKIKSIDWKGYDHKNDTSYNEYEKLLKKSIKRDNSPLIFLKKLKKERPVLFNLLSSGKKEELSELKLLLTGVGKI